ncbi:MAG: hypothetical protein RR198_01640 [Oscillospiraceae bacterium]
MNRLDLKMINTNRKIKRYILAFVLLCVSAVITVFIKDTVDSLNPEQSLPIASFSVGYTVPYVVRAGYTWSFGTKTVRSPYVPASDAPLVSYDCDPQTPINVNFSAPYESVAIYQSVGALSDEFVPMGENPQTPAEEGMYIYKVEAKFNRGDIMYYFLLQVKKSNHIA